MGVRLSDWPLCEVGISNGLMSVFLGRVVREIVLSDRDGTEDPTYMFVSILCH